MDVLMESSWRVYPSALLVVLGAVLLSAGLRRGLPGGPSAALPWMQGFRLAVLGLSLVGAGAGWLAGIPWLVVFWLVVGFEETLETSICAWALSREPAPASGDAR